jgi:hypothetical protein
MVATFHGSDPAWLHSVVRRSHHSHGGHRLQRPERNIGFGTELVWAEFIDNKLDNKQRNGPEIRALRFYLQLFTRNDARRWIMPLRLVRLPFRHFRSEES